MSIDSLPDSIRSIQRALNLPWELRANQTLLMYDIRPEAVTVLVEFLDVNETARETRYMRRGRRLSQWEARYDFTVERPEGEQWVGLWKYTEVVMWDDTFKPYIEHKLGKIETPAEYYARRRWEGDQYRVGSHKSPMDSAQRVSEGYSPMSDYWNK